MQELDAVQTSRVRAGCPVPDDKKKNKKKKAIAKQSRVFRSREYGCPSLIMTDTHPHFNNQLDRQSLRDPWQSQSPANTSVGALFLLSRLQNKSASHSLQGSGSDKRLSTAGSYWRQPAIVVGFDSTDNVTRHSVDKGCSIQVKMDREGQSARMANVKLRKALAQPPQ